MGAPPFLTSKLLSDAGLLHGFSLRTGGHSQGPFSSLNLSHAVGDETSTVDENLATLAKAAGLEGGKEAFATAAQVHGDRVMVASKSAHGWSLAELYTESQAAPLPTNLPGEPADAVVGFQPGDTVGVRVADCVPVLLANPLNGAVAAVHAGWRGARLSIAARGASALAPGSETPARVLAAIGPSIGRCCYQVSQELAAIFRALFGPEVADDPSATATPHLDLRLCVERSLLGAGLDAAHIEQVPGCTSCDAGSFFSHRRDAGRTGRHLAFIVAGRGGGAPVAEGRASPRQL